MVTSGSNKPFFDSFGKVLGLVATIVGIVGGILTIYDRATRPFLELELRIFYMWQVSVRNVGATTAKQVRIGVLTWRNDRPPGPDVMKSYGVYDLPPGTDGFVDIEVLAEPNDPEYRAYRARPSTSGYVVATCESCTAPRAWAFHIPGSEERAKEERFFPNRHRRWPIVEFRYPHRVPFLNDCVDYPRGVCNQEQAPSWNPESGSSRHDGIVLYPPAWDAR